MASFMSGLTNAASSALAGYVEQTDKEKKDQERKLIAAQALKHQQEREDQQAAEQRLRDNRAFILGGGVPAHTEQGTPDQVQLADTPATPASTDTAPPVVLHQPGMPGGAPGTDTPLAAMPRPIPKAPAPPPALPVQSLDGSNPKDVQVPDSYDPTGDRVYQRALTMANIRNDGLNTRSTDKIAATGVEKQKDRDSKESIAHDHDASREKVAGQLRANGGRSLTDNEKEHIKRANLPGLLSEYGGEDGLREYLTKDAQGQAYAAKVGISDADIAAASGTHRDKKTASVLRVSPTNAERGVKRVNDARDAVNNDEKPDPMKKQRAAYDAAASAIKAKNGDVIAELGPRP